MIIRHSLRLVLLIALLTRAGSGPLDRVVSPPAAAIDTVKKPRSPRVWANRRSRVYHCPGSKWYGVGTHGEWMSESQARARGFRPAYKRACGT